MTTEYFERALYKICRAVQATPIVTSLIAQAIFLVNHSTVEIHFVTRELEISIVT